MTQATSSEQHVAQAPSSANQKRTVLWAADLCERWGVSLATLWRWRRSGKMPLPDFQGSGWRMATIVAFENGEWCGQGARASRCAH